MMKKSVAQSKPQAQKPKAKANKPSGSSVSSPYASVRQDLGSLVGFPEMGKRVGGAIGRLFGKGDYEVKVNSLMGSYGMNSGGPPPPLTFRDGKRGTRFVEREMVALVYSGALSGSSSVFTNTSYAINPGNAALFPWLSTMARKFDQWEPNGIVLEFESTSSTFNGNTQALGTVVLATEYDAYDQPYASMIEMANSDYSTSCKSSDTAVHGIECDEKQRPTPVLYCLKPNQAPDGDLRMSNLGNFQIATEGISAAGIQLGKLWITYDITFYKKQISQGDPTLDALYNLYQPNALIAGSDTNIFGPVGTTYRSCGNTPGFRFTPNRLYFPPNLNGGTYAITHFACVRNGSSPTPTALPQPDVANSKNIVQYLSTSLNDRFNLQTGATFGLYLPQAPGSTSNAAAFGQNAFTYIIEVVDTDAFIQYTAWGSGTAAGVGWVHQIVQIPDTVIPIISLSSTVSST
nr:structural protein [Sobelivirales sp.]